jgi:hypothetical protein
MLCYAMLCYAMLCYAMLCYAMLCYAQDEPAAATARKSIAKQLSMTMLDDEGRSSKVQAARLDHAPALASPRLAPPRPRHAPAPLAPPRPRACACCSRAAALPLTAPAHPVAVQADRHNPVSGASSRYSGFSSNCSSVRSASGRVSPLDSPQQLGGSQIGLPALPPAAQGMPPPLPPPSMQPPLPPGLPPGLAARPAALITAAPVPPPSPSLRSSPTPWTH